MIALLLASCSFLSFDHIPKDSTIIVDTKRIVFEKFPDAFNPSLIQTDEGYLLTFRFCPDLVFDVHVSFIGIARLNHAFEPISEPQLLNTRIVNNHIPSQSEDARLFSYHNRLFLLFNDNPTLADPSPSQPRDMYIAELFQDQDHFRLSIPLKLFYEQSRWQIWQKNWIPFEWEKHLLLAYAISPHEILQPNFFDGECFSSYNTETPHTWDYGTLRGGTPALLVDGEYLSFFHSSVVIPPKSYRDPSAWFYFMGAYTFSPSPPFTITKMTSVPIFNDGFYDPEAYGKKVMFPGGFVDAGSVIYLAYGKDDCEMWIATLDKQALKKALIPLPLK